MRRAGLSGPTTPPSQPPDSRRHARARTPACPDAPLPVVIEHRRMLSGRSPTMSAAVACAPPPGGPVARGSGYCCVVQGTCPAMPRPSRTRLRGVVPAPPPRRGSTVTVWQLPHRADVEQVRAGHGQRRICGTRRPALPPLSVTSSRVVVGVPRVMTGMRPSSLAARKERLGARREPPPVIWPAVVVVRGATRDKA